MGGLCDRCYAPGACCKTMHLSDKDGNPQTVWADDQRLTSYDFFVPVCEIGRWTDQESGREYVNNLWRCTKLQDDGRCGDYENRPEICRKFEPASDGLCVHYMGAESGDPTVDASIAGA